LGFFTPVYAGTLLIDAVVLNVIEFWSGKNPVAFSGPENLEKIVSSNGKTFKVTMGNSVITVDRLDGPAAGRELTLRYDATTSSFYSDNSKGMATKVGSISGTVLSLYSPDGTVATRVLNAQNVQVAAGSAGAPPQQNTQTFELGILVNGQLKKTSDFEKVIVKTFPSTGELVYLKDVATVGLDAMTPWSVYSKDRTDESVEGIALLRRGENPSRVLVKLKEAVQELNESTLPQGVKIVPFYDRQYLVDSTLHTVELSVLLGITLVALALLLFLGRPAMAALGAVTIPFSLLFALILMYLTVPADYGPGLYVGQYALALGAGLLIAGAVVTVFLPPPMEDRPD